MKEEEGNPDRYYTKEYYNGKSDYSYLDERDSLNFHAHVWRARLKRIASFIPPPADLLDVGCSFGGFALETARAGYRASGIDVSAYAVEEAAKRGLNAYRADLEDHPFADESFDVVTMIEVVEHISQPKRAFESLAKLIRPGGLLVIQTANFDGLQAKRLGSNYNYYLPGHLFYYSKGNLRKILTEHGFSNLYFFHGVEFGLIPKLKKSRGDFKKWTDYLRWFRIALYHCKSKFAFGGFAWTSSMVVYAIRDSRQPADRAGR
jgi:2-polyprenyl-3-methyl-5-hydroxy-6-metoxy-1,4-benzoquinol methylase